MKALRYFTLISLIFTLSMANAQSIKPYKAKITLTNGTQVKGILHSANKGGIVLVEKNLKDTIAFVDAATIEMIQIRRKGKVGEGVWIGAVSGAVLGAVIGFASGDDKPRAGEWNILLYKAEEKALIAAVPLAVLGTGMGAIIASKSKKIDIKGNPEIYNTNLSSIKSYGLKNLM